MFDIEAPKKGVNKNQVIFRTAGPILGASLAVDIDYVIFIAPRVYGQLNINEKYEIARLVGKINSKIPKDTGQKTMLLGPGRWGTSSPSLGIPVNFAEVNGVSVIGEIAEMIRPYVTSDTLKFYSIREFEINLRENIEPRRQVPGMQLSIGLIPFVGERSESIRQQLEGELPSTNNGKGNEGKMQMPGMQDRPLNFPRRL